MAERTIEQHAEHRVEGRFLSRLRAGWRRFFPRRTAAAPPPVTTEQSAAIAEARNHDLPVSIGAYRLAKLSTNRRTGETLFVYRNGFGGTFCANAKGVHTRAQAEGQRPPTG